MDKKKLVLTFMFVIALMVGGTLFWNYQGNKVVEETKEKTWSYLTESMKYKESDIKKIEAALAQGGDNGVLVAVVFADEPDTEYTYQQVERKIVQVGVNGSKEASKKNKHAETGNGIIETSDGKEK